MAQTRARSSKQLWSHHPSRCSGDIGSQSPVVDFTEALWVPMRLTMMERQPCASVPLQQPLSVSMPGALIGLVSFYRQWKGLYWIVSLLKATPGFHWSVNQWLLGFISDGSNVVTLGYSQVGIITAMRPREK